MIQGQKLNDSEGNQVALFPMDRIQITQGVLENFSHQGLLALDLVGTTVRYPYYAPCDLRLAYVGGDASHSYYYESLNPVRWANGELDYITVWVVHDETIYNQPRTVSQGQLLGRTGNAGYSTGDHLHLSVGRGQFTGGYYNEFGNFTLNNQVHPANVFAVNDTDIINGYGYNWRIYQGGVSPPTPSPSDPRGLPIWLMGGVK